MYRIYRFFKLPSGSDQGQDITGADHRHFFNYFGIADSGHYPKIQAPAKFRSGNLIINFYP
jgi:hypothetical protein